ncbi:MAG: hypothetical protein GY909_16530 [Oligoflexia bacterium]|nr:hypothetical protein [Oligoflexia bacterium]
MQAPKQFIKWPLLVSGLFLFLFSFSILTQEPAEKDPAADRSGQDVQDIEKEMQNFRQSNQLLKAMENMDPEARKRLEAAVARGDSMAIMKEMKGLKLEGGKKVQMKDMLNMSLSTFQAQSEPDLINHFTSNVANTPAGPIVKKYPKVMTFFVKLLRDKIALPTLFQILDDRKKLIIFACVNLCTIILGFIIKRKQSVSNNGVFHGITQWFTRFTFLTALRIGIFIGFYGALARPSWNIFKRVFL